MKYNKLTAVVQQTGETLILFDGEKYHNFNRLHELIGEDYYNVSDDLMGGERWRYTKYENGDEVLTILFSYEVTEGRYVVEDSEGHSYKAFNTLEEAKAQAKAWSKEDMASDDEEVYLRVYAIRDMSNGIIAEEVF